MPISCCSLTRKTLSEQSWPEGDARHGPAALRITLLHLLEVTHDGRLILHGDLRAMLKEVKELLVDEWSAGVYHRELALPVPVNAVCANVTYGNGMLLVALPISDQTSPARLTLDRVAPTHGEHKGNAGHLATCVQT